VLFLRSGPRSFVHELLELDSNSGQERVLLRGADLLQGGQERLSPEEKARRERMRRPASRGISSFRLSRDGRKLLVPLSGRVFLLDRESGRHRELGGPDRPPAIDPRLSPDGRRVALVRQGDLYVLDAASGRERRLTRRRGPSVENGLAEFVAQEEMGRQRGFWWSPDSERLAYQQTDTSKVELVTIGDPLHPAAAPRRQRYPRPGKRNADVRLGVIPARGGKTRWIRWDRQAFPYLLRVVWPRRAPLTLVVMNRRQDRLRLLAADPTSGRTRLLMQEQDPVWLNVDPQMPRWLPDGSGFLWTTERQGSWQLELRARDGKPRRFVTPPDLGYQRLLDLDPKRDEVFVLASALPPESQIFRLPLLGSGRPQQVTRQAGQHGATFARKHGIYVHTVAPLSGPRRATVRGRDGRVLARLKAASERPLVTPNLELTTAGRRRLFAALVRPRRVDKGRRYPVVVYVYGGPTGLTVRATWHRYVLFQWIADHGFVVLMLDGRGTPRRGREWNRALRGNLVELPLQDQVDGLRALGSRYPELDLSRVGIFGWSFGGYLALMAALKRPDVYHAAVAAAPVTEWRDYDTFYTERYLGLPQENPEGYRQSSALTFAGELSRPLLVVHGMTDDNVLFSHTARLARALFLAGRRFELLPLTGTHLLHDPAATENLYSRVVGHFWRHLLQNKPSTAPAR
jgi:dipeptidyl-peptidase-4